MGSEIGKMKVVFPDESTISLNDDLDLSGFKELGKYVGYSDLTEKEIIEKHPDTVVLIPNKVKVTSRIFESMESLQLVAEIATGYDNVDLRAARENNVAVCNVAGYAVNTVPQHTFALILNLATKAYLYHNDVMGGDWAKSNSFTLLNYPAFELNDLTIGIIGFGTIGRGVARIAEAFGMKVLVYDIVEITGSNYTNVDLETILCESDVITVHTPLVEQTRNLIDAEALEKMKPTAIIINTARGGIVNEQALASALNSGEIAGAGFDVLTSEPPVEGNVLLEANNVMITPHSAWSTLQARQKLVDETIINIRSFFDGKPRNIVN